MGNGWLGGGAVPAEILKLLKLSGRHPRHEGVAGVGRQVPPTRSPPHPGGASSAAPATPGGGRQKRKVRRMHPTSR